MSASTPDKRGDFALGLHQQICRRDFLNATLLASGTALLGSQTPAQLFIENSAVWGGYTGVGDYRDANGNTEEVMLQGHAIRDGASDKPPAYSIDTKEFFDCIVVGGGISGLSAALFFKNQERSGRTCLVIDNHPIFGGEAKRNEFIVDGHLLNGPQGSNLLGPPIVGSAIGQFFDAIGLDWRSFEYQVWQGPSPEIHLSRTSYQGFFFMPPNFGFYFGARFGHQPGIWVTDPWGRNLEGTPFSAEMRSELLKWRQRENSAREDKPYKYEGDEGSRYLDSMTREEYLIKHEGLSRDTIRTFLAPIMAQGNGLGHDAISAFAPYAYGPSGGDGPESLLSWPGGNAGMARHIVKTLIPDSIQGPSTLQGVSRGRVNFDALDRPENSVRLRLRCTVIQVEHEREPEKSDFVWVTYTQAGATYRLKARSVVMAGGGWTTKHVVRDLTPEYHDAFSQFYRSACLVANVAVRNWRFLYQLGMSGGRWFEGFGHWTEVRKNGVFGTDDKTIGPDSPTVLTVYAPFFYPGLPTPEQGTKGRMELFSTPFLDYERKIREQFSDMFSASGFDARRDIAGIVLNRWGHAFVNPQPGFFFGKQGKPSPREVVRSKPFGRIAFANTDASGAMDHVNATAEAHRAVYQIWGLVS
jgi:spermidine dehydrogenase